MSVINSKKNGLLKFEFWLEPSKLFYISIQLWTIINCKKLIVIYINSVKIHCTII